MSHSKFRKNKDRQTRIYQKLSCGKIFEALPFHILKMRYPSHKLTIIQKTNSRTIVIHLPGRIP